MKKKIKKKRGDVFKLGDRVYMEESGVVTKIPPHHKPISISRCVIHPIQSFGHKLTKAFGDYPLKKEVKMKYTREQILNGIWGGG